MPYIDTSGPTLTVNVEHAAGYALLQSMLSGTIDSPLPRCDTIALEENGIIYCKLFI